MSVCMFKIRIRERNNMGRKEKWTRKIYRERKGKDGRLGKEQRSVLGEGKGRR